MKRKAQSTIEYVVLIGVITGALIATQVYIKRGLQGKVRDYAEQLNEGFYSPGATTSNFITTTETQEITNNIKAKGRGSKKTIADASTNVVTTAIEEVLSFEDEPKRW